MNAHVQFNTVSGAFECLAFPIFLGIQLNTWRAVIGTRKVVTHQVPNSNRKIIHHYNYDVKYDESYDENRNGAQTSLLEHGIEINTCSDYVLRIFHADCRLFE